MPEILAPFILAALAIDATATVVTIGGVAITAGTLATAATAVGLGILTIGLGVLLTPKPPKPENGSFAIQQSVAPRAYGYGTAAWAGYVAFLEESAGLLFQINALVGHEIDSFANFFLNSDPITISTVDGVTVNGLSDGRYNAAITIQTRLGAKPETPYDLGSSLASIWDSNHRGDSVASLYMRCVPPSTKNFSTLYPFARPQPRPVMNLRKVFDLRDPTQSPTDPTTWKFSKNSALCILHFECFCPYGPLRNYATAIEPIAAEWIVAANACDDPMPVKAGGTEPRYQLGGVTTTELDVRSTRQAMLATCDGWMIERGDGTLLLRVGKFDGSNLVVLTDDDIVGYTLQTGLPDEQRVNRIAATWTSPGLNYVTVDNDPVNDTADQAARNAIRTARLELTWVQSWSQCSRLQAREMIRQQAPARGQIRLKLSGINALYDRWILVNSTKIPRLNGMVIENRKPVLSLMAGACTMDFLQVGAEIDTYDPATQESAPPLIPTAPATVQLPIPANVTVVAEEAGAGSSATVFLSVSCDVPINSVTGDPETGINYVVQYRTSAVGMTPAGPWVQQTFANPIISGSRVEVDTSPVPIGINLDVQMGTSGTLLAVSQFSLLTVVSTAIAGVAPTSPTGFTATGGTGSAALACTNPNSGSFAYIQFYRAATGAPFASASPVGPPIYGAANATTAYTDTVVAGTYDYWATAANSFGTSSSPAGPQTATVT